MCQDGSFDSDEYDIVWEVGYVWCYRFFVDGGSSMVLMRFLMNSNDEKKMALTTQERLMDTPRPRYMSFLKKVILTGSTFSPLQCTSEFRW